MGSLLVFKLVFKMGGCWASVMLRTGKYKKGGIMREISSTIAKEWFLLRSPKISIIPPLEVWFRHTRASSSCVLTQPSPNVPLSFPLDRYAAKSQKGPRSRKQRGPKTRKE
ncbi:hypothetical protein B9G55_18520 [Saccharibacillus sp. O16]|nr:hypothetical protein B9G55_18520 [Saccharibacillus sp. O16]